MGKALIPAAMSHLTVFCSIYSLSIDERIKIAHNSSGSRVFDALLDSPTVSPKMKRQFVMDFIGHYHTLVDDKLGSRVGDRCWAFSDTYLKVLKNRCSSWKHISKFIIFQEKIAKSLITQEQALAASYYGKFFARNLNLYLLQRRPQDWRDLQSERKKVQDQQQKASTEPAKPVEIVEHPTDTPDTADQVTHHRKRKAAPENEIDALFNEKLGKRIKKGALSDAGPSAPVKKVDAPADRDLQQIFGAIRSAPGTDKKHRKKH